MKYNAIQSPTLHLFDFDRFPPSVANLNPALTVNSTTVYPMLRYKGGDAGVSVWNQWGYGQQLVYAVSGTAPTLNNGSPLLGSVDDSVLFNAGSFYRGANTSFGDITTEDICIECVATFPPSNAMRIVNKRANAAGYQLYHDGGYWLFFIQDGSGNTAFPLILGTASTFCHVMVFSNRDENSTNGMVMYVNGIASPGVNPSAVGSLSNSFQFAIGAAYDGGTPYSGNFLYCSMWKQASWFAAGAASPTEWQTIASTRFAQLTGTYPSQARGTTKLPTFTRTTTAYLDKIENNGTKKLYQVGAGWPRSCSRVDGNGATVKGYLAEASAQNICLQSEDLSTTWGNNAGDTFALNTSAAIAPNGTQTADGWILTNVLSSTHALWMTTTVTGNVCISVFAKNGPLGLNWLMISPNNDAAGAYFNLSTGVKGSMTGATAIASGMENYGNGWYRCWFVCSGNGDYAVLHGSNGDGSLNSQGDNTTVYMYIWGVQVEAGNYPTSYIPTTASPVTRSADVLTYTMSDGNLVAGKGTLFYNILTSNYTPTLDGYAVNISNAGSATARISSSIKSAKSNLAILNSTLQTNTSGTTTITDGKIHLIRDTWDTNDAKLYVADVQEGATAPAISVPTLTQLDISDGSGANQANAIIGNLKVFGKETLEK